MIDIVSLLIGFLIGVIVAAIAIELSMKKSNNQVSSSKYARDWSISEISNPKIMAEYLSDVKIPKNSKIIVSTYKDKEKLDGLNIREHKGIKGNFIIGDERALILSGPVRQDELGFWTVEKDIVRLLKDEFDKTWNKAKKIEFKENKNKKRR